MMKRSFLPGVCENGGRVDEDVDDSPPDDDAVLSIDLGRRRPPHRIARGGFCRVAATAVFVVRLALRRSIDLIESR